jgi:hypothetical protein
MEPKLVQAHDELPLFSNEEHCPPSFRSMIKEAMIASLQQDGVPFLTVIASHERIWRADIIGNGISSSM